MEPIKKCVSLETAKKLKEAAFKQDTERWWMADQGEWVICQIHEKEVFEKAPYNTEMIAAPDAQEILEQMPVGFQITKNESATLGKITSIKFLESVDKELWGSWGKDNYIEEMAECWLWLKSQHLI